MEKIVQADIRDDCFEMIEQGVTFKHAIINFPARIGDWPSVKTWFDLKDTVNATFEVIDKCMAEDGMVTMFNWGDCKTAIDDWLNTNKNRFEFIEEFRLWTGESIYDKQVLAGKRVENFRWMTLRRVGQSVTPGSYAFPDSMFPSKWDFTQEGVTLDGRRMWPVQSLEENEDSPVDWWKTKKLNPPQRLAVQCELFKFHLLDIGDKPSEKPNFIRIPFGCGDWEEDPINTVQQREFLAKAANGHADMPATRHVLSQGDSHRTNLVWFYYHWLMRHTAAGDDIFIPFTGDGDAILASLIAGRGFYGVEVNTDRSRICKDLLLEYRVRFPQ